MRTCSLIICFILFANQLFADATPFKDNEEIHLKYNTTYNLKLDSCAIINIEKNQSVDTFSGCEGGNCVEVSNNQKIVLLRIIPQKFCVILYFKNRKYVSPILTQNGGYSFHELLITDESVIEITPIFRTTYSNYFLALSITIMIELLAASIFSLVWGFPLKDLQFVVYANLITHPILWIVAANITGFTLGNIIGEPLVIVAEGFIFYKLINPKLSISRAFILSCAINILSFLIGGIIYLLIKD